MIFNNRFHEEEPPDADVEQEWQIEILRRAREIDEGLVQLVPWSELRARLIKTS